MSKPVVLDGRSLAPGDVEDIAHGKVSVSIAGAAQATVRQSRQIVERHLESAIPVYGLNTGLGVRVTEVLPKEELQNFSYRMVRGRAQGVGEPLSIPMSRAAVAVRLNTMLDGAAGQSPGVAEGLADCLNRGLAPVMPGTASIGAGDLVAMAALAHAVIGEGEMYYEGQRLRASEALKRAGLEPLKLGPKDGQVLCNNTAFTSGQAALTFTRMERLIAAQMAAGALSLEGFRGNVSPVRNAVAELRPQNGHVASAQKLRGWLAGGLLLENSQARRLQDPLSLRCMATVFGAAHAALESFREALSVELNSSSDNPAVLLGTQEIVSTGNFHQLQLALCADLSARALAWCATDSVSRVARLMSPAFSDLPPLLSSDAAERAGFGPLMKPLEALRAEIVQLATPVPIMPSHNADGQEDSLSHAPLAVQKLERLVGHHELVVAFEILAAAQAVDLAKPRRVAPRLAEVMQAVRAISPFIEEDRPLGREVEAIADRLVRNGRLAQL